MNQNGRPGEPKCVRFGAVGAVWGPIEDVSEVFSDFSKEPIAAASLGQVHLGTLKKNGLKVAVKVQRAGLRELFATPGAQRVGRRAPPAGGQTARLRRWAKGSAAGHPCARPRRTSPRLSW